MIRNPKEPLNPNHGIIIRYGKIRHIFIVDTRKNLKDKALIAAISIIKQPRTNYFYIVQSSAKKGYGPILYESAMEYIKPNYLAPSYDTNRFSSKIWRVFMERKDICKKPYKGKIIKEFEKYIYTTRYKLPGYKNAIQMGKSWMRSQRKITGWNNQRIFRTLTREGDKLFNQYRGKKV